LVRPGTGPTSGLPSGAKVKGPLMICLMPAFSSAGKCSEADFQRRRDAVEIRRQQLVAEIPRRVDRRPGLAGLLIGAEQHALALLAGVDLALEIDDANQFACRCLVELATTSGISSVSRYMCSMASTGSSIPTMRPTSRAQRPPALTTCSARTVPLLGDDVPGAVGFLCTISSTGCQHDLGAEIRAALA
jgi:hypothetical protein